MWRGCIPSARTRWRLKSSCIHSCLTPRLTRVHKATWNSVSSLHLPSTLLLETRKLHQPLIRLVLTARTTMRLDLHLQPLALTSLKHCPITMDHLRVGLASRQWVVPKTKEWGLLMASTRPNPFGQRQRPWRTGPTDCAPQERFSLHQVSPLPPHPSPALALSILPQGRITMCTPKLEGREAMVFLKFWYR